MAKKKKTVSNPLKEQKPVNRGKRSTNVILSSCYKQSQDLGWTAKKWLAFRKSVKGAERDRDFLLKKCREYFTV